MKLIPAIATITSTFGMKETSGGKKVVNYMVGIKQDYFSCVSFNHCAQEINSLKVGDKILIKEWRVVANNATGEYKVTIFVDEIAII